MDGAMIALILARADNGVIGRDGGLPWHLSEDLRRFKALTLGKPVVMGRKTWESLPRKPLPGRDNIVVSRQSGYAAAGARIASSLAAALAMAQDAPEIMIIGGVEIFLAALPLASRIYLTEIHDAPPGEVTMPPFAPERWQETARENHVSADGLSFSFVCLEGKLT